MTKALIVGSNSLHRAMIQLVGALDPIRRYISQRPSVFRAVLVAFVLAVLILVLNFWVPFANFKDDFATPGLAGFRFQLLQGVARGYQRFNVPLVFLPADGGQPSPVEAQGDDLGLYFWIPLIAKYFALDVAQVTSIFFKFSILLALLVSASGFFLLLRKWVFKLVSAVALFWIAHRLYAMPDQLATSGCVSFAAIPWSLLFYRRAPIKAFGVFLFASGVMLKFCQTIRSNSATPVILFLVLLIFFGDSIQLKVRRTKFIMMTCFVAGYLTFTSGFFFATSNRAEFFEKNGQSLAPYSSGHPFWHTAYLSLGFVPNSHGIVVSDGNSYEAVRQYRPDVPSFSRESESILRLLWWRLLLKDPKFIFTNIYRKSRVVVIDFIYPFLLAWAASFLLLRRRRLDLAFLGGLSVASITGIIATPEYYYMTGIYGFTIAYLLVFLDDVMDPKIEFLGA